MELLLLCCYGPHFKEEETGAVRVHNDFPSLHS